MLIFTISVQFEEREKIPEKGAHWLGPGIIISLNKNGTNLREKQANIVLMMRTFKHVNTYNLITLNTISKGYKCTLKSFKKKVLQTGWFIYNYQDYWWGKNLVFAMTIKLIPEFWRNQEIPEKFCKAYKQVKFDLFQIYYLFLILFLIPEFCHSEPRPTTLRSYLTYYV